MAGRLHHEQIFRGSEAIAKLASLRVTICGAGALGSNVAVNLARQGVNKLYVIDDDRVELHNVGTQVYSIDDVGGQKAEILRNLIYRDTGEEISLSTKRLTQANSAKLLAGADLIIDAFDNSSSRSAVTTYCHAQKVDCIHAGLNDQYGELRWNEFYRVPSDRGEDVCDYPLARNLVMLISALASELVVRFALTGAKENLSVTLADLSINKDD